jgi:zinc finger HIT domain-containing protein 1
MSDKRTLRTRKVSQRMAVVDESERKRVGSLYACLLAHVFRHVDGAIGAHQAVAARLDALENDASVRGAFDVGSDDEEFDLREELSDEEGQDGPKSGKRKRKKKSVGGGMRKTRGMIADKTKGPKGFKDLLEEAELERLPEDQPSYLTAAVGPPRTTSIRKFCSVCGDKSPYICTRCGARYCTIRCYTVHTDTRCLKFMA